MTASASTASDQPPVTELLQAAVAALGGTPRAGQSRMAQIIDEAAATGRHAVIQAGTGTGKSLAYLVPAVRHALSSGRPVVISTATLALQNQLISRDIPAVAAALGDALGTEISSQVVKGKAHYVCRHKISGGYADEFQESLFDTEPLPGRQVAAGPATRLGQQVRAVHEWAHNTDTGDRDDMPEAVVDQAWAQVSVSARDCLGTRACPVADDCFAERARAAAATAHVVVTNHAMLAIDAFENHHLLPEHSLLVVDEAHELADRVTSVVTLELTPALLSTCLKRSGAVGACSDELQDAVEIMLGHLEYLGVRRYPKGLPATMREALGVLAEAAKGAYSQCPSPTDAGTADPAAAKVARTALTELLAVVERLLEVDNEYSVVWASRNFRDPEGTPVTVHVAPLWVSGLLASSLFSDRTVVLTSATLTVSGGFDAVARRWGLPPEAAQLDPVGDNAALAWSGEDVGSPFDYPNQGILYCAKHLPPPGRGGASPEAETELATLLTAAGGRTLGLFSSRAAAEAAAQRMRELTDLQILCQGQLPTPELVRTFSEEEETCLFGTLGLWQGVDVPGRTCSLVVIDRIPFPRPDDPLATARSEAIGRNGGNGFLSVSGYHAALLLAQGAGRLIRSVADKGVVAVLDSRLATARYGGYLVSALPPFWATTQTHKVVAALERVRDDGAAQ